MTDATILNFGKRLTFLYYLTNQLLNLVEILRICYRIHTWSRKGQITKIQHGIRRHLEFRRSISISLSFERLSTNLVGIRLGTHLSHIKCIVTIQMAAATIYLDPVKGCNFMTIAYNQLPPNLVSLLRPCYSTKFLTL